MAENERMMKEMEEKWEEKLAAAEQENKVAWKFLNGYIFLCFIYFARYLE